MTQAGDYLVVSNSAESPYPYLSFIDTDRRRDPVVARYTSTTATGGLGGVQWWHGHLYVSVSTSTASPNGGEVDELDISDVRHVRVVHRYGFGSCQASVLAVTQDGLAAVGCGGGAQEVLNLRTGAQATVAGVPGAGRGYRGGVPRRPQDQGLVALYTPVGDAR